METERYSLEKAQEEAAKLKKKVESGEASNYIDAEQQLEAIEKFEIIATNIETFIAEQDNPEWRTHPSGEFFMLRSRN
jgi:hypothetical protein